MELYHSDKPKKRFYALVEGKRIYFGEPGGFTYIDGASDAARAAYRKRHYANKTEKYRIDNDILSPALLSWHLLWGESRDICENFNYFS
jgi:hypothetical protein